MGCVLYGCVNLFQINIFLRTTVKYKGGSGKNSILGFFQAIGGTAVHICGKIQKINKTDRFFVIGSGGDQSYEIIS